MNRNNIKDEKTKVDSSILYYRIPEGAKAISISKTHLWQLIKMGEIPIYRISKKITLVKASELFDYIERFKVA